MSTKRLRRRAHTPEPKDSDRLSLAPLTFEEAVKGALATKPPKDDSAEEDTEEEADSGDD